MTCTCIKTEVGKGKGKVKGFIVVELCSECEAKRKEDAIKSLEQQEEIDVNIMVAEKSQEMAKAELVKEGKLKVKNDKLKKA